MRTPLVLAVIVYSFALMLTAPPSSADQVWLIQGTSTLTGSNVCSPAPCSETMNFSFLFEWQLAPDPGNQYPAEYDPSFVPGSMQANFSGPLGNYSSTNNGDVFCCGPGYYLPFYGDGEIDLILSQPEGPDAPGTPVVYESVFYSCMTATCYADFPNPSQEDDFAVTYTATLVPEPAELELAALGTLLIGLWVAFRPKNNSRATAKP